MLGLCFGNRDSRGPLDLHHLGFIDGNLAKGVRRCNIQNEVNGPILFQSAGMR
jgi:hypothetical protein